MSKHIRLHVQLSLKIGCRSSVVPFEQSNKNIMDLNDLLDKGDLWGQEVCLLHFRAHANNGWLNHICDIPNKWFNHHCTAVPLLREIRDAIWNGKPKKMGSNRQSEAVVAIQARGRVLLVINKPNFVTLVFKAKEIAKDRGSKSKDCEGEDDDQQPLGPDLELPISVLDTTTLQWFLNELNNDIQVMIEAQDLAQKTKALALAQKKKASVPDALLAATAGDGPDAPHALPAATAGDGSDAPQATPLEIDEDAAKQGNDDSDDSDEHPSDEVAECRPDEHGPNWRKRELSIELGVRGDLALASGIQNLMSHKNCKTAVWCASRVCIRVQRKSNKALSNFTISYVNKSIKLIKAGDSPAKERLLNNIRETFAAALEFLNEDD